MSRSPVNGSAAPTPRAAWFGKLPGLGDFVGRRMPHSLSNNWDYWLRAGLDQLRIEAPEHWAERFVQAPLWCFFLPASIAGTPMCGVVAPSVDRVGRFYPISVLAIPSADEKGYAADPVLAEFFRRVVGTIIDARRFSLVAEDLDARLAWLPWPYANGAAAVPSSAADDILSILGDVTCSVSPDDAAGLLPQAAWRDMIYGESETSVWWVCPAGQARYQEIIHHGPLHRQLFVKLFLGRNR